MSEVPAPQPAALSELSASDSAEAPPAESRGVVRAVRTEGGWIIADLAGPLSMTSAEVLREQLFRLLSPAARHLVVDLSAVTYVDIGGLAVLVGTGHRARQLGGSLRLAAVSPEAAAALSMAGLDGKLETFGTVQSAAGAAPA